MSVYRQNPITGAWGILAPDRGERPNAFTSGELSSGQCPFCPGNEEMTPAELIRYGSADQWSLRVFPNKYPAASADSTFDAAGPSPIASGRHEVIVESPDHNASIDTLAPEAMAAATRAYRDRYAALSPSFACTAVFKNDGRTAGASIAHVHSQVLAVPFLPRRIAEETWAFESAAACPLCKKDIGTLIDEGRYFRWVSPHAAGLPYQQWVFPRTHEPNFGTMTDDAVQELSDILQRSARSMRRVLSRSSIPFAFNWAFINFKPRRCHWYLEIEPRMTVFAGFEIGSGSLIQIIDPAQAARELRDRS